MRTDIHIGFFDVFIFLGVFQGLFLAWFFIKNGNKEKPANLYQGFLLLFLSFGMFEEWLNNTGLIVQALYFTNFSEPFSLAFAPLIYLYVKSSLDPRDTKNNRVHFIIPLLWLFYMFFQFIQPDLAKYNDYIHTKHPDWGYLPAPEFWVSADPVGFRQYTNEIMAVSFLVYISASIVYLVKKSKEAGQSLFRTDNRLLVILRNTLIHFIVVIFLFVVTKMYYGIKSDVGGYFIASYLSLIIYITSYQVLNSSSFFSQPGSFLSFPMVKYRKSSLSEERKETILARVIKEMETNKYYTNNLASLSGLSKQINESSHHVSQVINEKLDKNFFELLAGYRVDYAMKLIRDDKEGKYTVEELAEMVGYNSKSSFNNAFKTITSKTPSEYRKSIARS